MTYPSVDVLIATRDRARFIRTALQSVRKQTLQPNQVIVVDDGSTDDTPAILAEIAGSWSRLQVISTAPRGVSAARNAGIAWSSSELIAFLDDDDIWEPQKLERQVALFTPDRPQLGIVNCGFQQIDIKGRPIRGGKEVVPTCRGDIFFALLEEFYAIAPSSLVARRSKLVEIGGFNTEIAVGEDRELCLRLARVVEADYVPDLLVGHRQHPSSVYRSAMRHKPETVLFQRLGIWEQWHDQMRDTQKVRRRFRNEATAAAISAIWNPRRLVALHRRLENSEMRLARSLFRDRNDYLGAVVEALGVLPTRRSRQRRAISLLASFKMAVAERLILPSPHLLRLAQMLGKFEGMNPARPSDRELH